MKKVLFSILSATFILSSCNKETGPGAQAQVKFINASVNAANAQVYFNEELLIGSTIFPEASNYAFVQVGSPTARVQVTSSASISYNFSGMVSLKENYNYTIIGADSAGKMKTSIVEDNIATPATGKANVRFFHLIGNAPTLTVDTSLITTTGGPLFSSRTFNDQSTNSSSASFITVNAATYNFKAKDASGTLFTKSITLNSGGIYTIIASGAIGGTASTPQAPAFTVLQNN